jgi:hypothetical protein
MMCREIEPYIVDVARGRLEGPAPGTEVARHLSACSRCAALLENERTMSAAFRRLAREAEELSQGPSGEAALLAAFDAAWAPPRGRVRVQTWVSAAAAALLVIGATGATVMWMKARHAPRPGGVTPRPAAASPPAAALLPVPPALPVVRRHPPHRDSGYRGYRGYRGKETSTARRPMESVEFVLWPGSAALPTFESGELVRLDLPTSVLPSLGLSPPASQVAVVQADVLIGQDGFVRAVRLVPEP